MTDSNAGLTPDHPGSSDFFLGQMAQSIKSLRDDLALLRSDLRHMSNSYATRTEVDQVRQRVTTLEESSSDMASSNASRKWIDRGVLAVLGIIGSVVTLVAFAIIKPAIIP